MLLYIVLAYLMLFAALSNAFCLYDAFLFINIIIIFFGHCFLHMLFVFMFCLCLLTHSLFISCIILHHALYF